MTNVIRIGKAHLVVNIIDLNQKTICLVLPGGGYTLLSNRESAPVATKLNLAGFNTAVLYYSCEAMTPLDEGLEALKILSETHDNIVVFGFSAGGHLASLLATSPKKYNLKAGVLAYPVITLKEYTHEETAKKFLGEFDNIENRNKYSSEERVDSATVPCFRLHDDQSHKSRCHGSHEPRSKAAYRQARHRTRRTACCPHTCGFRPSLQGEPYSKGPSKHFVETQRNLHRQP